MPYVPEQMKKASDNIEIDCMAFILLSPHNFLINQANLIDLFYHTVIASGVICGRKIILQMILDSSLLDSVLNHFMGTIYFANLGYFYF